MKKLIIAMSLLLSVNTVNAQTDSVTITKIVDEMEGTSYLLPSERIIIANKEATKGFIIDAILTEEFILRTLYVKMIGIGSCNEEDKIIIQLEDGEKITSTSWKDFNCDGEAYFRLTKIDIDKLKNSPISKIRMTNGRTYDSYTGETLPEQSRWFIQLFYAMDNNLFTLQKE
jgi:hypothetical protein